LTAKGPINISGPPHPAEIQAIASVIGREIGEKLERGRHTLLMERYGYRWYRVGAWEP
jgi:hypothetical protein